MQRERPVMSKLVLPHGGGPLRPLLVDAQHRAAELSQAERLKAVPMTSRESSDLVMLAMGAYTPLDGFMGHDDWRGVCSGMKLASGLFWPIPITLSCRQDLADSIGADEEVALIDARKGLQMFQRVNVPVLGIVENMSYFLCPDCDTRHAIFGEGGGARTAEELGVPLLAQIPLEPQVVVAGDSGKPIVLADPSSAVASAFVELAGEVARKLSVLNAEPPPVLHEIQWLDSPS